MNTQVAAPERKTYSAPTLNPLGQVLLTSCPGDSWRAPKYP